MPEVTFGGDDIGGLRVLNLYTPGTPIKLYKEYISSSSHCHDMIKIDDEIGDVEEIDEVFIEGGISDMVYDVVVIHGEYEGQNSELLMYTGEYISSDSFSGDMAVLYVPYSNISGYRTYQNWKENVLDRDSMSFDADAFVDEPINMFIPEKEIRKNFCFNEGTEINVYSNPCLGVNMEKIKQCNIREGIENNEIKYDILYVGAMTKENNSYTLFNILNKVSDEIDKHISVGIANRITPHGHQYSPKEMSEMTQENIKVDYIGEVGREKYMNLAQHSSAVLFSDIDISQQFYPGLIEAAMLGCNVVTADWGYVPNEIPDSSVINTKQNSDDSENYEIKLNNHSEELYNKNNREIIDVDNAAQTILNFISSSENEVAFPDRKLNNKYDERWLDAILADISGNENSVNFNEYRKHVDLTSKSRRSDSHDLLMYEGSEEERTVPDPLTPTEIIKFSNTTDSLIHPNELYENEHNVLHIGNENFAGHGSKLMVEERKVSHYSIDLCLPGYGCPSENFLGQVLEYYRDYVNLFDAVVVHNKDHFLRCVDKLVDDDTKLVFIPHTNICNENKINTWKDTTKMVNKTPLNILLATKRSIPLFPHYNNIELNVYISPTCGVPKKDFKCLHNTDELVNFDYDIFTFGRIYPEKSTHRSIVAAKRLAEMRDEEISVCIAGHDRSDRAKRYWKHKCEPLIDDSINVDKVGFVRTQKLYRLMTESKLIFLPSTMGREHFHTSVWEALSVRDEVISTNWAAAGDALLGDKGYAVPVYKNNNEIELTDEINKFNDLSNEEISEMEKCNNYTIDMDKAVDVMDEILDKPNSEININYSIPEFARRNTFDNAILDIINDNEPYTESKYMNTKHPKTLDPLTSIQY